MAQKESVQHLAQYLTHVPSSYTFSPNNPDPIIDEEIPTIDFSLLTSGNQNQRSKVVHDLGNACGDWGFFSVINHGVKESLRKRMLDVCQGFFNLAEDEKQKYASKSFLGPIRYGTSFNPVVEKVFYWRDYIKFFLHPVCYSPDKPVCFRDVASEYSTNIGKMARELLRGIAESLGLKEGYIDQALELDSGLHLMVVNFYPCCPQPELAMGMPPHSDHGLLTVLAQNDVGGLQVKHNGGWVQVHPSPDSFLVNIGDHMEIFSNGKYKSVLHRAVVNNKTARISIGISHGPSIDNLVTPAPQLVDDENHPLAYQTMKYRDYLEMQQRGQLDGKSCLEKLRK